jgi:hypothetical protein
MATKYGVNATIALNQATGIPALINQGELHSKLRVMYDSYTLTADLASGDVIKLGSPLPAGARVIGIQMWFDDLDAAGGTVNLGWAASASGEPGTAEVADDDGFIAAADVTSAGIVIGLVGVAGLFKKFTAPVQVQAATAGDTDATSGSIKVAITYILD